MVIREYDDQIKVFLISEESVKLFKQGIDVANHPMIDC